MAPDGMHPVDWMGLAAFKDATNDFMSVTSSVSQLAGLTLSTTLAGWFAATGLFGDAINESIVFNQLGGRNIIEANARCKNKSRSVCLFINGTMLDPNPEISCGISRANHFVVLIDEFRLNGQYIYP